MERILFVLLAWIEILLKLNQMRYIFWLEIHQRQLILTFILRQSTKFMFFLNKNIIKSYQHYSFLKNFNFFNSMSNLKKKNKVLNGVLSVSVFICAVSLKTLYRIEIYSTNSKKYDERQKKFHLSTTIWMKWIINWLGCILFSQFCVCVYVLVCLQTFTEYFS